jgi:glycosyltransferase involved in cell wall biosynthesis
MRPLIYYFVDDTEISFVLEDVKLVAKRYEKVVLFSIDVIENKEDLPANIVIVEEFMDWPKFPKMKILFSNLFRILPIYFTEMIKLRKYLPFRLSIAILCSNIFKASEVERHIRSLGLGNKQNVIFYSFWFYDCIYLAWLKQSGFAKVAVTRTHAGDLFEERSSLKRHILFRHYQFRHLDKVFPIAELGTRYLQEKYSEQQDKIETVYLGSHYHNFESGFDKDNIVLVSCAKIKDIKRVHLIAETLMHIDFPVTWHHLGDENLSARNDPSIAQYLESKEKLKTKSNITYVAHGLVDNEKIYEFYKNNKISLFISLSYSEGIPVSMMEAISFGIPVLATDVGGCCEIVNSRTGLLIPRDTDTHEVAGILDGFRNSPMNSEPFRKGVRRFWELTYNEVKNYNDFFEKMESIDEGLNQD